MIPVNEWQKCSECGQVDFIPQIDGNTKCYECLGIGFKKYQGGYKKIPIPGDIRLAVFERDNYTCRHCGSKENLQADHIVPEKRGGKAVMDNMQTLCKTCNIKKGAK